MTRAGRVPRPTRGSQSACSGGKWRTCTSQPVIAGTAIAAATSSRAATRPTQGARDRVEVSRCGLVTATRRA